MQTQRKLMDTQEAQKMIIEKSGDYISYQRVSCLCAAGKIEGFKKSGRWQIYYDSVEKYERRRPGRKHTPR